MRELLLSTLMSFGVAGALAHPALAQGSTDPTQCSTTANDLRAELDETVVREPTTERRVNQWISGAENECLNGDPEPLERVARLIEDTRWVNEQDWLAGTN